MNITRPLVLVALSAASALALTGCSVTDLVAGRSDARFATQAELAERWSPDVEWMPQDGTDIRVLYYSPRQQAVVRATSGDALDSAICTKTKRLSAPTLTQPDAPDVYSLDEVWGCGQWSVVPTEDGWFGWTPNAEEEEAASS